jgi:hypothetical protein
MQKIVVSVIIPLFFLLTAYTANSSVIIPFDNKPVSGTAIYRKISSLKVKDMQRSLGRKMTLKEKIGFLLLKHQPRHQTGDGKTQGSTAFSFALIGLGLLLLGLFIPYVIIGSIVAAILAVALGSTAYKENHADKKAHAAKIIGWLTLGLVALFALLAVIIIATWTSWF